MACEWVFLKKDGSKEVESLDDDMPTLGDGKSHNDVGYCVRHIVKGKFKDVIIATEI